MSTAGYVLAGGASRRMGRDKALLPFRGVPLACHVADLARQAAGSAALVGDPRRLAGLGFPAVPDFAPGEGPLGGILAALRHSEADWNLVTACDMPGLAVPLLRALLAEAAAAPRDALICRHPEGRLEPLCAVYRRSSLAGLERAWSEGVRSVRQALEHIDFGTFPVSDPSLLQNLNTPWEWAAHAA